MNNHDVPTLADSMLGRPTEAEALKVIEARNKFQASYDRLKITASLSSDPDARDVARTALAVMRGDPAFDMWVSAGGKK